MLNGLLAWRNARWMIAGNWFSLCRPDQSAHASCQVLWKQMKAGAAVPSLDHWTAWIGSTKSAPGAQTDPTTRQLDQQAAVPANNTATAGNTAPGNGAQGASSDAPGIIRLDRTSYPPMALAHVNWSNFPATATIQVWFAPVGSAPKTEIGKGLFLNSPYGKVDMRVPWPDQSYQVRFMILSDSKHVYNGPRFFVQPATTFATPPVGHYGCWFYFWGHDTWRSSISWVAISGPKTYQEPRGSGTYIFERPKATVRMTSGPLAGRVAHIYIDDKGRKDILFTFQDNTDAHGNATIDNGDTNCYLGQK